MQNSANRDALVSYITDTIPLWLHARKGVEPHVTPTVYEVTQERKLLFGLIPYTTTRRIAIRMPGWKLKSFKHGTYILEDGRLHISGMSSQPVSASVELYESYTVNDPAIDYDILHKIKMELERDFGSR